ncbi:hypothetical protein [Salinimonas lutimaris]|uniref:hypothetical protein n=1 Tax=Salinimonas lutimaris TaxID=914153 RepID=UPI0010C1030D|nr:hypothetical protein [Salinimonas lutimaris]
MKIINALLLTATMVTPSKVIAGESQYLCIADVVSGLAFKSSKWETTDFLSGAKYLLKLQNEDLVSVKEFGAPDEFIMPSCEKMANVQSQKCESNFDTFRFQPSTKRFVYAKTSGFTNEYEELGIPLKATDFTPHIAIGTCEEL